MDELPSFKELSDKISRIRKVQNDKKNIKSESNETKVFNICIEFIVIIGVGSFLGYSLDKYFNTMPILLIIGFLLGAVAGMINIVKLAKKLGDKE
ncbi:Putative F0F1-ATPase subunit (ATPase_gene1) [Rickettsiales bacterium Ac37b]|nr:Putative F0F1-ATPase subunit (ATPase_gene1) [Rickettsiales bacterium Ac37b]